MQAADADGPCANTGTSGADGLEDGRRDDLSDDLKEGRKDGVKDGRKDGKHDPDDVRKHDRKHEVKDDLKDDPKDDSKHDLTHDPKDEVKDDRKDDRKDGLANDQVRDEHAVRGVLVHDGDDDADLGTAALFAEPDELSRRPEEPRTVRFERTAAARARTLQLRLPQTHPLWAHHLWNAARLMADYLDTHARQLLAGRAVLELGAGCALPSLVAADRGAATVVITDYPDAPLLETIRYNVAASGIRPAGAVAVEGFVWGHSTDVLRRHLSGGGDHGFDTILLSDTLFNHSQQPALVSSCAALLRRSSDARLVVFYSHHRPWLADRDLAFFDLCRTRGLVGHRLVEQFVGPMWQHDRGPADVRGIGLNERRRPQR